MSRVQESLNLLDALEVRLRALGIKGTQKPLRTLKKIRNMLKADQLDLDLP